MNGSLLHVIRQRRKDMAVTNPAHCPDWIAQRTGGYIAADLPAVEISAQAARAFFTITPRRSSLSTFQEGFAARSRAADVAFFVLALDEYDAGRLARMHFAHVAANMWQLGKQTTALAEFGLDRCPPRKLLDAIRRYRVSEVVMSDDDLAVFRALPDRFDVYRGGLEACDEDDPHTTNLDTGYSWTIDEAVATGFVRRSVMWNDGDPVVVRRTIAKRDVIAYFHDGEREIIIAPRSWRGSRIHNYPSAA